MIRPYTGAPLLLLVAVAVAVADDRLSGWTL